MHKIRLLNRISDLKTDDPLFNFGVEKSYEVVADYLKNYSEFRDVIEYVEFFTEKAPAHAKEVMNAMYNLQDLLSTFPQEK